MSDAGVGRLRRVGSLALRLFGILVVIVASGVGALLLFVPSEPHCLPPGETSHGEVAAGKFSRFVTDVFGPIVGYPLSHVRWRRGYLEADPTFQARLAEILQPFDIVVLKDGFKLTDRIIPGIFGHVVIWLGNERQLRDIGLWEHPSVKPLQADIRSGRAAIEAVPGRTDLAPIGVLLDADRLAVARVRPPDHDVAAWRCDLATLVIGLLKRPYDYSFDVDNQDRVTCAEIVYQAFRKVAWETHTLFGRRAILPDDILRMGFSNATGVDVVAYFLGDPDRRWEERPIAELDAELQAECAQ
jgi:hypothetical protein